MSRYNSCAAWGAPVSLHFGPDDTSVESIIGQRIKPRADGCWIFDGNPDGYGKVTVRGHFVRVHRWVYETLVGPIDDDCHLHHTCLTPGCCNPRHLVPLTPKEHRAAHRVARAG